MIRPGAWFKLTLFIMKLEEETNAKGNMNKNINLTGEITVGKVKNAQEFLTACQ